MYMSCYFGGKDAKDAVYAGRRRSDCARCMCGCAGNSSSSGAVGVSDPLAPKEASKPPAATIKPMIKPVLNVKVKKRKADGAAGGAKAKKGSEGGAAAGGAKAGANGGAKEVKKEAAPVSAPAPSAGLGGLLAGYGSSEED